MTSQLLECSTHHLFELHLGNSQPCAKQGVATVAFFGFALAADFDLAFAFAFAFAAGTSLTRVSFFLEEFCPDLTLLAILFL